MTRSGRTAAWILIVILGIGALFLVTALIGTRDERKSVSANEYAENVCSAVGTWRGSIEALADDIRRPAALGGLQSSEPQSETPQSRTGFVRNGLQRAIEATSTLSEGIARSGVPETPQGEQVAELFQNWADTTEDQLSAASEALEQDPETLEQSLDQVAGAATTISKSVATGVATVAQAAATDPELVPAFRSADACGELRASRGGS